MTDLNRIREHPATEAFRAELVRILEIVANEGLHLPRDLDVALDAAMCAAEEWLEQVAGVGRK